MALIVQKYGGTSVGNVDRIKNVAAKIKSFWDRGDKVVVVVSARSGVTNELIARAKSISPNPSEREMDMMLATGEQETIALTAMALHAIGVPAVSRTGAQAGIITDVCHSRAHISRLTGGDILDRLEEGKVVIVAGFQGISSDNEITTLGRGGSDLTAIALAAAIKADVCQIYTDVDGVYTADPRIVLKARKLQRICYEEMLEMASNGSKVMQSRSVEFAQKYGVTFEVRSSFNNQPGTIVKSFEKTMEDAVVSGVALDRTQTRVTVGDLPDTPAAIAAIFDALGEAAVSVDLIVKNVAKSAGAANLTFSVNTDQVQRAEKAIGEALKKIGSGTFRSSGEIAKVSIVGVGMTSHPGVAGTLFRALSEAGINSELVTTSEIKISVGVAPDKADDAVRAIHAAFGLDAPAAQ
ncbi:aspartate kinase [Candidatus Spyradosoma sp. SGI.093]|uniref:aspartate kinase n=1 Tax=Candidatus Spyradosoma sp. SGI.093 TaxID=3420583 RepID=UPI003D067E88